MRTWGDSSMTDPRRGFQRLSVARSRLRRPFQVDNSRALDRRRSSFRDHCFQGIRWAIATLGLRTGDHSHPRLRWSWSWTRLTRRRSWWSPYCFILELYVGSILEWLARLNNCDCQRTPYCLDDEAKDIIHFSMNFVMLEVGGNFK